MNDRGNIQEVVEDTIQAHAPWLDQTACYSGGCGCAQLFPAEEDHEKHQAEMVVKAVGEFLHAAYEEGFSSGYDDAADDIGAWASILDHAADGGETPDTGNPYKKEA